MSGSPSRSEVNTIFFPSWDHRGNMLLGARFPRPTAQAMPSGVFPVGNVLTSLRATRSITIARSDSGLVMMARLPSGAIVITLGVAESGIFAIILRAAASNHDRVL